MQYAREKNQRKNPEGRTAPRKTQKNRAEGGGGGSAPTRPLLDLIRLIHLVSFLHRDEWAHFFYPVRRAPIADKDRGDYGGESLYSNQVYMSDRIASPDMDIPRR